MRYCIAHNPLLLQPLGHWFTFISRKYEHLAVGSSGVGLTDSRGSLPLGLPCPLRLYPYCITTWEICQEVFFRFLSIQSSCGHLLRKPYRLRPRLTSWLLLHCITHRAICQGVFYIFFSSLARWVSGSICHQSLPMQEVLQWYTLCPSPLDTTDYTTSAPRLQ